MQSSRRGLITGAAALAAYAALPKGARAGSMALLGVGKASAGGGVTPATFIAQASGHPVGTTISLSGFTAGDLLIAWVDQNGTLPNPFTSPGNAGVAYTPLDIAYAATGGFLGSIAYRVLNAADITSGLDIANPNNTYGLISYRGATTAALGVHANDPGLSATVLVPGFTPGGSSKGVVLCALEGVDSITPVALSVSPGTWVSRMASRPWSTVDYANDELTGYSSAISTVSGFNNTGGTAKIVWMIDLG